MSAGLLPSEDYLRELARWLYDKHGEDPRLCDCAAALAEAGESMRRLRFDVLKAESALAVAERKITELEVDVKAARQIINTREART